MVAHGSHTSFCVLGVGFWSAVVAGNQAAPVLTMPDALRAHLKGEESEAKVNPALTGPILVESTKLVASEDIDIMD